MRRSTSAAGSLSRSTLRSITICGREHRGAEGGRVDEGAGGGGEYGRGEVRQGLTSLWQDTNVAAEVGQVR